MKKYLLIGPVAVLMISTFYPGLKKERAISALNQTNWVAKQHIDSKVLEQDLHIIPVPFGALVSTYEGMWYVTFWGKVM